MGAAHGLVVVRRLQRGLAAAGYAPGPVDGRYGPLTAAAVKRFQANHGLRVDGIVGPVTRRAMRAWPVLALGAGVGSVEGSPAVARLQRLLRHAGFRPGAIDGRFGVQTERALVAFQRARHLSVDGIAGAVTGRALQAGPRLTGQPAGPQGAAAASHSTPARHGSQPAPHGSQPARHGSQPATHGSQPSGHTPKPRPRPARTVTPAAPRAPIIWILIGVGVVGLMAMLTGYFQRSIRSGAGRWGRAVGAIGKDRPPPQPESESEPEAEPGPEPAGVTFRLYEDNSGGYYWTIVDDGGEVLARSAAFASYEEANVAADTVYRGIAAATFEDRSQTSPPPDLPAAGQERVQAERWLDPAPGANRQQVTPRAKDANWTWPAGSSDPPGGRRR